MKALLCRNIEENEVKIIKRGQRAEEIMFYVSRAYVPFSFFRLYRRGVFDEYFTFSELKAVVRIALGMYFISLLGHAMMRYISMPVVDKYIGENEEAFVGKRKQFMDDYLI